MRIKGCFLIFQAATQCSSDAVSFKNLVKGREWTMKMDMEDADMTLWTEADFEEKCTYIVNDHPWDPSADGGTLTQAEASLPRNLTFKYASNCKEVSGGAWGRLESDEPNHGASESVRSPCLPFFTHARYATTECCPLAFKMGLS